MADEKFVDSDSSVRTRGIITTFIPTAKQFKDEDGNVVSGTAALELQRQKMQEAEEALEAAKQEDGVDEVPAKDAEEIQHESKEAKAMQEALGTDKEVKEDGRKTPAATPKVPDVKPKAAHTPKKDVEDKK